MNVFMWIAILGIFFLCSLLILIVCNTISVVWNWYGLPRYSEQPHLLITDVSIVMIMTGIVNPLIVSVWSSYMVHCFHNTATIKFHMLPYILGNGINNSEDVHSIVIFSTWILTILYVHHTSLCLLSWNTYI